jgi:hypothetical protein
MKIIIGLAFLGIVGSLVSALYFMMRDQGRTRNTVRALSVRVGLSVALFLFLMFAYYMGWIESRGVPIGAP